MTIAKSIKVGAHMLLRQMFGVLDGRDGSPKSVVSNSVDLRPASDSFHKLFQPHASTMLNEARPVTMIRSSLHEAEKPLPRPQHTRFMTINPICSSRSGVTGRERRILSASSKQSRARTRFSSRDPRSWTNKTVAKLARVAARTSAYSDAWIAPNSRTVLVDRTRLATK